jgi:hypothetical protein
MTPEHYGATVGAATGVMPTAFEVPITVPSTVTAGSSFLLLVLSPDGGEGTYSHLTVTKHCFGPVPVFDGTECSLHQGYALRSTYTDAGSGSQPNTYLTP